MVKAVLTSLANLDWNWLNNSTSFLDYTTVQSKLLNVSPERELAISTQRMVGMIKPKANSLWAVK